MKRRKTGSRSGESIVEVMVSAVIFLMLVAALQTAIMFCNSAQRKSQQIREDTATICENLQMTSPQGNGMGTYEFYASSADGTVIGNKVFTITAEKQKKQVSYTGADGDTSNATFYLYGSGGGSGP